jgi:sulfite reductase (NADPH) flavoprotein alpha-component
MLTFKVLISYDCGIEFQKRRFVKKGLWFRTHWLLSIVLGAIIAVIGVTGAALSFRGEITELLNQDVMRVDSKGKTPMALNELLQKASAELGDARINSIWLFSDPNKTARLSVSAAGATNMRGRAQYINPYTAELLPSESLRGEAFFSLMIRWHRWLGAAGGGGNVVNWGKQTVAIATIALIVISVTGLYLYLPFMRRNFYASLKVDFKKKGRGFLYKLHSVFGVWTLIFVLLMSFTGLWWSYDWYRSGIYWIAGVEKPASRGQTPALQPQPNAENRAQNGAGEGGGERAARPIDANAANQVAAQGAPNAQNVVAPAAPAARTSEDYLEATKAYDMFKQTVGDDYISVTLSLPQHDAKLFTLSYVPLNPAHSRASNRLQLNTETSEIVKHTKYEDKTLGEKFIDSIFPLHSGDFFGVAGLILYCVSSLAMALFAITGYMLYYERFARETKRKRVKRQEEAMANKETPQVAVNPAGIDPKLD